jgi:D-glycero-alpha-D-manno-heptose-7-phosphate kinase
VSSTVHESVIAELESEGSTAPRLDALRRCAELSRDAMYAGDFAALGHAMRENTAVQQRLHPDLVSEDATTVIDVAKAHGALGWKVNGAGGEGGSVTLLLGPSATAKRALVQALTHTDPLYQVIPTYLSRTGLRVWEAAASPPA